MTQTSLLLVGEQGWRSCDPKINIRIINPLYIHCWWYGRLESRFDSGRSSIRGSKSWSFGRSQSAFAFDFRKISAGYGYSILFQTEEILCELSPE
jgi:hypothetical protein